MLSDDAFVFDEMITRALHEDVRTGDVTSRLVLDEVAPGSGAIIAREPLVVSCLDLAASVFQRLDAEVKVTSLAKEGESVEAGTKLALVEGSLHSLLAAERVALNLLQRACGIATATRRCVTLVEGSGVHVLDTRKTAPGLRALDKRAVRAGGGTNHRQALDDMVLIKDNHLAAVKSLRTAVERALAGAGRMLVEVEVDSLEALDALLALERLPHAVLLDNFTPKEVADAVARVAGRLYVEVSGGVTLETLQAYAMARPDGISMGALTHSVKASDIALDIEPT